MKGISLFEIICYFIIGIIHFIIFRDNIDYYNLTIMVTLVIILGYHFFAYFKFHKLHGIYGYRYQKKFFRPVSNGIEIGKQEISRERDIIVIVIFLLYITIAVVCSIYNIIDEHIIMTGVCILLALNSYFKYKSCWIRKLVFRSRINCCMDCHINGWDNLLIFTVLGCLYFKASINNVNKILVGIILLLSIIHYVRWEYNLSYKSERYFPVTNQTLSCENCPKNKKCNGELQHKFQDVAKYKIKTNYNIDIFGLLSEFYVIISFIFAIFCVVIIGFLVGKSFFIKNSIFFVVFFFEIPLWEPIYIWIKRKYKILYNDSIYPIIENIQGIDKNSTRKKLCKNMFEVSNGHNFFIYFVSYTIIMGICIYLFVSKRIEIPNLNNIKLIIFFIFVAVMWLIGCKALVIFYNAFKQFSRIASYDIKMDYFSQGMFFLEKIKKFCNESIVIIVLVCISLVMAIFNAPLDLTSDEMKFSVVIVLLILASFPTVIMFGSFKFINEIKNKMITYTLNNYNYKIKQSLENKTALKIVIKDIEFVQQLTKIGNRRSNIDRTFFFTIFSGIIQCITILDEFNFINIIKKLF